MKPIDAVIFEATRETLGIYPKGWYKDGVYVPRSEWQSGWNAAVIQLIHETKRIHAWIAQMSDEQSDALLLLLDKDVAWLHTDDDEITCLLNMNDTFYYASSDAEEVPVEELLSVARIWERFGSTGLTAWAAIRREDTPLRELQTEAYFTALDALKQEMDKP